MKEVAIHVNEAIRARENREKIQELEKRWSGYRFYQPGRFFIREVLFSSPKFKYIYKKIYA